MYNVRERLSKCIDSLIRQTYSAVEIILIDDGSTDGSDKICDEYANKYGQIKVIHIPNGGVGNARNIGLDMATGDYITFVDSDDWIEANFFELGIHKLHSNDADIFVGEFMEVYEDGRKKYLDRKIPEQIFYGEKAIENTFVWDKNKVAIHWFVWGRIFRASLLKNIRFDTELSMGEDAKALWDIMQGADKVVYTPTVIYDYYQRSDSVMHTLSTKHIIDNLRFHKYLVKECKNKPQMLNYFKKRLDVVRLGSILYAQRNREFCDELTDEKIFFRTHLYRHICSEYELQSGLIWTLLKIGTACMPDFVMHSIIKIRFIFR